MADFIYNNLHWQTPYPAEHLGLLPEFLHANDPRPAREQLHENYAHGGGYHPFKGFTLSEDSEGYVISYPGDPDYREVARVQLREETIVIFPFSWAAVIQPSGDFVIARMD
jgi:hypothetical protein